MQSKIPGGYIPAWIPSSVFWISSGELKWKHHLTEETGGRYCGSTPRGTSPFAPTTNELTSEAWKRAERPSEARDCERNGWGGAFFFFFLDNWGPPRAFRWCCSACASRLGERGGGKVEHHNTARPSLIPRLCKRHPSQHRQELKEGEAESQLSLSFSRLLSVHWLIARVTAATFIISTYLIRK